MSLSAGMSRRLAITSIKNCGSALESADLAEAQGVSHCNPIKVISSKIQSLRKFFMITLLSIMRCWLTIDIKVRRRGIYVKP